MKALPFLLCVTMALNAQQDVSQSDCMQKEAPKVQKKPAKKNPCEPQGEVLNCYGPAYNAPAVIDVNSKDWRCRCDDMTHFFDASLTYWYAGEEGLDIASSGILSAGTDYFAQKTHTLFQSFDYKPGFKVGAGIVGYRDWMIHAEYTWFRGENNTNSGKALSGTGPTAGIATTTALSGSPVWIVDDWFLQGTPTQALSGSSVSSTWRLAMDLIDAVGGRPFYQGRHFSVSPFGGLRAALIRQSMTVNLTESSSLFSSALSHQPIQSRTHSNSWAIGPRFGCDGQCILPMGFRLEGDLAINLLWTRYTSVKHSEDMAATTFNVGPYTTSYSSYSALRPELDMGLGFGWGRYLCNQDYHIDFSANYDFMMFWSQNMMRRLLDGTLGGTNSSASDLYLHGMTLSGRFDF